MPARQRSMPCNHCPSHARPCPALRRRLLPRYARSSLAPLCFEMLLMVAEVEDASPEMPSAREAPPLPGGLPAQSKQIHLLAAMSRGRQARSFMQRAHAMFLAC